MPAADMPLPRTAALLVNSRARKGRRAFRRVEAGLKAAGIELTMARLIDCPARLPAAARAAADGGVPLVIVGGGDGTVSSALGALAGSPALCGVLPLGTANSLARALGLPLDVGRAVDVLATGRRRRIDLGRIDGHNFANCASIGISALIAETIPAAWKRWLGRIGLVGWSLLVFGRFRPFRLVVRVEAGGVDGGQETLDAVEVRIANGPYHGGTRLVDQAELDSGTLVVQAVLGRSRGRLACNWIASALRLRARTAATRLFRGSVIHIRTEPPLPISLDGELWARTPATVRVVPAAVELVVPRQPG